MEHTSEAVADGKLLHETSYPQRAERYTEIELSVPFEQHILKGKIDFYDARNKIIHETKRSDKLETAHEWQSKFYIWLLELNGIAAAKAILEYPKLRERKEVVLSDTDRSLLKVQISEIVVLSAGKCPGVIKSRICKSCSYYELCYVNE